MSKKAAKQDGDRVNEPKTNLEWIDSALGDVRGTPISDIRKRAKDMGFDHKPYGSKKRDLLKAMRKEAEQGAQQETQQESQQEEELVSGEGGAPTFTPSRIPEVSMKDSVKFFKATRSAKALDPYSQGSLVLYRTEEDKKPLAAEVHSAILNRSKFFEDGTIEVLGYNLWEDDRGFIGVNLKDLTADPEALKAAKKSQKRKARKKAKGKGRKSNG